MNLSISFKNYSKFEWELSDHGSNVNIQGDPTLSLVKSPSGHLKAHDGVEDYAVNSTTMGALSDGGFEYWCSWYNLSTGQIIGVKIHVPVQVFEIGTAPYWYVTNTNPPNWEKSGSNPSSPYTWPKIDGVNVVARPTAGHSSLTVEVTID